MRTHRPEPLRPFATLLLLLSLLPLTTRAQTTVLTTSPSTPVFFLQLSDPQFGMFSNNHDFAQETANFEFAIATANRLKPQFVVITGDLTNRSGDAAQAAEYHRIVKQLDPAIHLYNVPGNHDVGNKPTPALIAAYVRQFGPDHYRFREGDLVGFVLDSALLHTPDAAPDEAAAQQQWLASELPKARQEPGVRYVVVFQHHPPFLKTADEPDQYFNLPLVRRTPFLELLHQNGVEHLFCGHLHQDKTAHDGSLEVAVTGATGKPLGGTRSGFRLAVARDGRIANRYVDLGDVPNHVDPTTWPDGELLRPKREPTKTERPQ